MPKKNDGKINIKAEKKQTQKSQSDSFSKSDQITSKPQSSKNLNEPATAVNSRTVKNDENNTAGEYPNKFDKLIEKFIQKITERLTGAAKTLYKEIKDTSRFDIPDHFYVPGNDSEFATLMGKVTKDILDIIMCLQESSKDVKLSVSVCFEKNNLSIYSPYEMMSNYDKITVDKKSALRYVVINKQTGKGYDFKNSRIIRPTDRKELPNGAIPFGERFVKNIKYDAENSKVVDGEFNNEIIERDPQKINSYFDDGNNLKKGKEYPDPEKPIQNRSQLLVIPLECRQAGGKRPRRIGYLQVVGYIFQNEKNDTIKSNFLGPENGPKEKLIVNILKCYAQFIVLSNKIESVKNIDIDLKRPFRFI